MRQWAFYFFDQNLVMAMTPIAYDNGRVFSLPVGASTTIAKGDAVKWSSNVVVPGADGDETAPYVALDSVATGSGETATVRVVDASNAPGVVRFKVDTASNTAVTNLGVAYELSAAGVVDNGTASSGRGFIIEGLVGAATDKKAIGRWQ